MDFKLRYKNGGKVTGRAGKENVSEETKPAVPVISRHTKRNVKSAFDIGFTSFMEKGGLV